MSKVPDTSYVDEVADKAVHKVFWYLGVDINDPASVSEFQADLRFGRQLRKSSSHAWLIFCALLVTGITSALWAGVQALFHK